MYLKLVDFGLVVLTWMVQLVVYPSFMYYDEASMVKWHVPYTQNITYIVMPLMLGQVVLHAWGTFQDFSIVRLIALIMVVATWAITFLYAVPLHGKIGAGVDLNDAIQTLIRVHWIRTVLWTLIFLLTMFLLPGNRGLAD